MYEAYWGLSEPPFDNSPNPKFFYLSPEHEEALVRLVYMVSHRKGCGMLTGEYGCGKTTLSRALIQRLEAERYEIGLLTNPSWNAVDFLREVLYQLGVETEEKHKPELLHLLNDTFYRNYQAGRDSVVIVDEAQLIEDDAVFEELRLLLNFQTDNRFLVTLLLIAAPPPRREPEHAPAHETPAPSPPPATAPTAASVASAEALFGGLLRFLAGVRDLVMTGSVAFPWDGLERLLVHAIASLERSGELFWVANNPAAPLDVDYLAFHQAQVGVLSMRIGADVGYDRRRLVPLGMAGCLLDVGLWQLPESVLRRLDALTSAEQAQYRSHPKLSAEVVRRWGPPGEGIVEAVLQHHEREQEQGFPQGLAGAAIHPDAKILGLIDTYTGLTVPPSARPRLRPHEAIRDIVKSKHEAFASPLIKALLSEISVFPPGTLVRLNTGEVGRVVAVNRNHPLRPRLEVVADGKGHRFPTPKTVDLSEAPFIYITGPVAEGAR